MADAPTTTPTAPTDNTVTVTIDGKPHQFPKGTVLLEACNAVGANVPFFCYHPGLSSPAVCRQCLVDVKGQPKPVPSSYTPVADKMEVTTASPRVLDVRRQMLEFTLLNHPIDCPICDKAGECTLQKHYFDWDAKYAIFAPFSDPQLGDLQRLSFSSCTRIAPAESAAVIAMVALS
jgi:NADH-quinone oxidoreductase subunit G